MTKPEQDAKYTDIHETIVKAINVKYQPEAVILIMGFAKEDEDPRIDHTCAMTEMGKKNLQSFINVLRQITDELQVEADKLASGPADTDGDAFAG